MPDSAGEAGGWNAVGLTTNRRTNGCTTAASRAKTA
jgi:hypothetical protein